MSSVAVEMENIENKKVMSLFNGKIKEKDS
jgi:hypothetical protein